MIALKKTFAVVRSFMVKRRNFLSGSLFEYAIIAVLFFLLTLLYTNFTLFNGTHQLFVEGPGDGTAGFLWFNDVDTDNSPAFGYTNMANYPMGENLQNPTQIAYTAVLMPLWLLSKLFGPVMGLNIVTFFGFWGCGMAMYWLMKKLIKSIPIAFFSGFAATFMPYHIVKSSSHLTYIFSMVFVFIIGAFIGFWKKPTWQRALLLAATIALAYYTDGYYLLIATVFVTCLFIGALIFEFMTHSNKKALLRKIKYFLLSIFMLMVMVVPVAYTQLSQGSKVDSVLAKARGSIAFDINYYATRPIDYFLPSPLNPFLENNPEFQKLVEYKNQHSNGSESMTYIGYTLILLSVIGGVFVLVYMFKRRQSSLGKYKYRQDFLFIAALGFVSIPVLVLCMMPPHIEVFGVRLIMPSGVLLHFNITLWRVMARFFLPLHVMFTIIAGMSLSLIIKTSRFNASKKQIKYIFEYSLVALLLLLVAAEYATLTSRPSFDFNNLPKVYTWLSKQPDIKVVAEMPILDRPLSISYDFVTAQIIHGKKLVNTPLTNNEIGSHNALGDIDSPEAVNYAILSGADTIISHDRLCTNPTWGSLVYIDKNDGLARESQYYGSPICVYRVKADAVSKTDPMFVNLKWGTFSDAPYIDPITKDEYSMLYGNSGTLSIVDDRNRPVVGMANFSAEIVSTPYRGLLGGSWWLYQDGIILARGTLPGKVSVDIDASKSIYIKVLNNKGDNPSTYQASLKDIIVTAKR